MRAIAAWMFLDPNGAIGVWPWALTPLTARTVAAFVALPAIAWLGIAADGRWSAAKRMLETVAIGLVLLLVAVARAWAQFDHGSPLSYAYVGGLAGTLCAIGALYGWMQRGSSPAEAPMLGASRSEIDDEHRRTSHRNDRSDGAAGRGRCRLDRAPFPGRSTHIGSGVRPGYYEEGWSAKDLVAHIGAWLAEAAMMLQRIAVGTYRHEDVDIDAMNKLSLEAMRDIEFPTVKAVASSARTRMRHSVLELSGPSPEAAWWIAKAGPEHYANHLPRLREWVEELRSP